MKVNSFNSRQMAIQSLLPGFLKGSNISFNSAEAKRNTSDTLSISPEGYEKMQQAVFDKFFNSLSEENQGKIVTLEKGMQPLLEKEENGTISKEEQEQLDALFQKFDKIISDNSDEETSRILLS